MLDDAYVAAKDLLRFRMVDLRAGAILLLERETITPDDLPPFNREEAAPVAKRAALA
jgi:cell division protease FtsH